MTPQVHFRSVASAPVSAQSGSTTEKSELASRGAQRSRSARREPCRSVVHENRKHLEVYSRHRRCGGMLVTGVCGGILVTEVCCCILVRRRSRQLQRCRVLISKWLVGDWVLAEIDHAFLRAGGCADINGRFTIEIVGERAQSTRQQRCRCHRLLAASTSTSAGA